MKQVLQNLRTGATGLADVPTPLCRPRHLLVATRRSLISAGTERSLVEFGRANLLAKARAQPERLGQVLDKIRSDGLLPTVEAVFSRLDQPLPLGYCNAGVVLEVGQGVTGLAVGDRVVSNGPHDEVVCVPQNLCAHIPRGVGDDDAAFTVLAAVALQGIRLAQPALGENVAVLGLGLVGLMTVQMLVANGCRVLATDFDAQRLELARLSGAQTVDLDAGGDPVAAGLAFSGGRGVDAVLITASTKSSDPVRQAAQMSRQRGRIVLVGVTGLELSRRDFCEKELTFQVSCAYGPGRYDKRYEQGGQDYPFGFVRWTAQRNFQAVLNLMAEGRLDVRPLVSHRVALSDTAEAYRLLTEDRTALGILLTYPEEAPEPQRTVQMRPPVTTSAVAEVTVGVIGAGNFATLVLLPALARTQARLRTVASAGGVSASHAAAKFGFEQATSDYHTILADTEISTVFIATRHNTHARMVAEALRAGKHVFVEKPLALNSDELAAVRRALGETRGRQLLVGFNRRFSSLAIRMRQLLASRSQPISIVYTVNAGTVPDDHWVQDPQVGGGRIIGEACHFIDLVRYLVDQPVAGLEARMMGEAPGVGVRQDKITLLLEFADGSTGAVHYLANGSKRYPKERVEAFCERRVLVLDNFRALRGYGWPGFRKRRLWRQDKGHAPEIAAFIDRVTSGGAPLISWPELEEVTLATFAAVERASQPSRPLSTEWAPYAETRG